MGLLVYKPESYRIIGLCMEAHSWLGSGFSEIVYKDALEVEFGRALVEYEREKRYRVTYKDVILPHSYIADFVLFDKIILEVKAVKEITDVHIGIAINYLKVSQNRLAIIVNFGAEHLEYRRVVL